MWFKYLLLLYFALGAIATILGIGRPREPITAGVGAGVTVITILLMIGLLHYWK